MDSLTSMSVESSAEPVVCAGEFTGAVVVTRGTTLVVVGRVVTGAGVVTTGFGATTGGAAGGGGGGAMSAGGATVVADMGTAGSAEEVSTLVGFSSD